MEENGFGKAFSGLNTGLFYPNNWANVNMLNLSLQIKTNANISQFNHINGRIVIYFNLLPRRRHAAETELPMTHQRRKLTN